MSGLSRLVSRRDFIRLIGTCGAAAAVAGCAAPSATAGTTKLRRIGYLGGGVRAEVTTAGETFRQALRGLGYVDGEHIVIELRAADTVLDRVPGLAAELLSLPVDVLVTTGSPAALAARRATGTIPVVFMRASDPVGQGIVASLARPGANITGVSAVSVGPKQLEMLRTLVPGLKRVAVLWNANNPGAELQLREIQAAANELHLSLELFAIHNPEELTIALDTIALARPDGLLVAPAFNIAFDRSQIPTFAASLRLPQVYSTDVPFVAAGGLMAVGSNFAAEAGSAAVLVDKILRGARPADLPVQLPSQIDFLLNVSAAERIGLKIPDSVLRQATEVLR
jgi:putative ABC transport system substrate-binding protein